MIDRLRRINEESEALSQASHLRHKTGISLDSSTFDAFNTVDVAPPIDASNAIDVTSGQSLLHNLYMTINATQGMPTLISCPKLMKTTCRKILQTALLYKQ